MRETLEMNVCYVYSVNWIIFSIMHDKIDLLTDKFDCLILQ